jgi:hypothetical protein
MVVICGSRRLAFARGFVGPMMGFLAQTAENPQ